MPRNLIRKCYHKKRFFDNIGIWSEEGWQNGNALVLKTSGRKPLEVRALHPPPEIMQKIIPIILIFLGEGLAIYSEIVAAKNINTFAATFWKMSGVMTLAGLLLIAGYMFGLKYLNNIWIVGVVSIGGIIIMEPVITYLLFQEFPSRGALIGLVLGILGLLSALFIK